MPRVPDLTAPVRHATTTAAHPRPTGVGTTICVLILLLFGGLIGLIALIVFMTVGGRVIEGLRAQTAEAVVLSVRQDTYCNYAGLYASPICSPVYLPTVRFATAQGEHVDAELIDFFNDESEVSVGSWLKVHYDPLNPDHVQENRWLNTNNIPVVVTLIMLLAFVLLYHVYLGVRQVVTGDKKR